MIINTLQGLHTGIYIFLPLLYNITRSIEYNTQKEVKLNKTR